MRKLIIFTDLDGTLLHAETYSFDEARPAIELIRKVKIPLILCSSKTRMEIDVYRTRLENRDPFVSENGGGIFVPEGYFDCRVEGRTENNYRMITLGKPYDEVRKVFAEIQKRTGVRVKGFGDMSAGEVSRLTGLKPSEAELAKVRDFDEPFVFEEGEKRVAEFLHSIEDAGFNWTQGRFYHMLGAHDKGRAVKILTKYYERTYGDVKTIGIGDSFNDLPLLQSVDYPVLVQKKDGSYDERLHLPHLIRAKGIGPAGWNRAVMTILKDIV